MNKKRLWYSFLYAVLIVTGSDLTLNAVKTGSYLRGYIGGLMLLLGGVLLGRMTTSDKR